MHKMTDTHKLRADKQLMSNMTELIINSEVQHIIKTTVAKVLADYQAVNLRLSEEIWGVRELAEEAKSLEPAGPPSSNTSNKEFQVSDFNIFYSDLEDSYEEGDIMFIRCEIIYCDMYSFDWWVKNYMLSKESEVIYKNISTCLRGAALEW